MLLVCRFVVVVWWFSGFSMLCMKFVEGVGWFFSGVLLIGMKGMMKG